MAWEFMCLSGGGFANGEIALVHKEEKQTIRVFSTAFAELIDSCNVTTPEELIAFFDINAGAFILSSEDDHTTEEWGVRDNVEVDGFNFYFDYQRCQDIVQLHVHGPDEIVREITPDPSQEGRRLITFYRKDTNSFHHRTKAVNDVALSNEFRFLFISPSCFIKGSQVYLTSENQEPIYAGEATTDFYLKDAVNEFQSFADDKDTEGLPAFVQFLYNEGYTKRHMPTVVDFDNPDTL